MTRRLVQDDPSAAGKESTAHSARTTFPVWRGVLLLAALDRLLFAAWALVRPGDLFGLLQLPPPRDAFLWPALGFLALGNVACLVLAARRWREWGGLVLVPLIGQFLEAGLWLWLLGTDRLVLPSRPLLILFAHDAVWLPVFAAFLVVWRRSGGSAAGTMEGGKAPTVPTQGNGS